MEHKIGPVLWLLIAMLVLCAAFMPHSGLLIAVKYNISSVKSEAKYDDCYTVD